MTDNLSTAAPDPNVDSDSELEGVQEIERILDTIPQEKRESIIKVIAQSEYYRGPVMPPALLRELEGVIPGGAERVLRLTEKEQDHRHRVVESQTDIYAWQAKASLIGGVIAFCLLVFAIVYCAHKDYVWGVGALSTVGAFGVIPHIINVASRYKKEPMHRKKTRK